MILYLLPLALGGCTSLSHQADPPPGQTSANGGAKPSSAPNSAPGTAARGNKTVTDGLGGTRDRNGFSDKLTHEQEYNAHLELGRFQESQENFELALGEYLKALEASESRSTLLAGAKNSSKQALAHRRMASALDRMGRFEQAENEYSTALKLSPNDPKIWNDAGYSFYLQGRWTDAQRALKTAAKLDPNNTKIMTNLGLNLAASGKSDEALAELTKAGGQAAGHANLAYILASMGKTAEAEKHYKLALEVQPQLEPAKAALIALSARTAYAAQTAAASANSPAKSPLLIDQPGVLPVAALRQPPPVEAKPVARVVPVRTPAPVAQAAANAPKLALSPTQARRIARVAPTVSAQPGAIAPARLASIPAQGTRAAGVPPAAMVDPALKRTAAPPPRPVVPALPPLPIPAPMPMPGAVPPYVPPASN